MRKGRTRKIFVFVILFCFILTSILVFVPKDENKPPTEDPIAEEPVKPGYVDPKPVEEESDDERLEVVSFKQPSSFVPADNEPFAIPSGLLVWMVFTAAEGAPVRINIESGAQLRPPSRLTGIGEDKAQTEIPTDALVSFEIDNSMRIGFIGLEAADFLKTPSEAWIKNKGKGDLPVVFDAEIGSASGKPLEADWGAPGNFVVIVSVANDFQREEAISIIQSLLR